jgi:hypothetical protein
VKKLETFEEDVACIRACLERILNHMNSGLYKDYQLEKWGRIVKTKPKQEKFDTKKFLYAHDPVIGKRCVHTISRGYAVSLVSGHRFKWDWGKSAAKATKKAGRW